MSHMHYFLRNLRHPVWKAGLASIHRASGSQGSRKSGFRYTGFSETKLPVKSILGNSAIFQVLLHWVRTLRWGAWSNKEE